MKIVIDISCLSSSPYTGVNNLLHSLILSLQQRKDINLKYFALAAKGSLKDLKKEYPGVKTISVPSRYLSQSLSLIQKINLPLDLFFSSADAVLSMDWLCLPLVKGKTVAIIADMTPISNPEWHTADNVRWFGNRLKNIEKNADLVIAISKETKKEILKHSNIKSSIIKVIYPGVPQKFNIKITGAMKKKVRQKYKLPEKYLLFVGTQEPRKNLKSLLRALSLVNKKEKINLVICGVKGWGKFEKFGRNIHEIKYISHLDLPAVYSLASGLLYPSLKEGFGMPIVEAFSVKTPVLTSNLSSMREVAGDAALLVNPDSVTDIKKGIEKLISLSAEEKLNLQKRGKKRLAQFSFATMADSILSEIKKT